MARYFAFRESKTVEMKMCCNVMVKMSRKSQLTDKLCRLRKMKETVKLLWDEKITFLYIELFLTKAHATLHEISKSITKAEICEVFVLFIRRGTAEFGSAQVKLIIGMLLKQECSLYVNYFIHFNID